MYKWQIAEGYEITKPTLERWLKKVKGLGKTIGNHYSPKQVEMIQEKYGKFSRNIRKKARKKK